MGLTFIRQICPTSACRGIGKTGRRWVESDSFNPYSPAELRWKVCRLSYCRPMVTSTRIVVHLLQAAEGGHLFITQRIPLLFLGRRCYAGEVVCFAFMGCSLPVY